MTTHGHRSLPSSPSDSLSEVAGGGIHLPSNIGIRSTRGARRHYFSLPRTLQNFLSCNSVVLLLSSSMHTLE